MTSGSWVFQSSPGFARGGLSLHCGHLESRRLNAGFADIAAVSCSPCHPIKLSIHGLQLESYLFSSRCLLMAHVFVQQGERLFLGTSTRRARMRLQPRLFQPRLTSGPSLNFLFISVNAHPLDLPSHSESFFRR